MNLEILTPEKSLFKGEIHSVSLPGKKGSFTVLKNHAPLISTLTKGSIAFQTKDYKEESVLITGGVMEVKNNSIIVLADV